MITELGSFALLLAFALSLAQAGTSFAARVRRDATLRGAGEGAAFGAFIAVAIAFAALMHAFVTSDFSVMNVADNSHHRQTPALQGRRRLGQPRGLDAALVPGFDRVSARRWPCSGAGFRVG